MKQQKPNAKLEALLLAGQMCSNLCYSIAQQKVAGFDLSARTAFVRWDMAMHKFNADRRKQKKNYKSGK